jgi:hypothetical protein
MASAIWDGGDGAKELALLADLGVDAHKLARKGCFGGLGGTDALGLALLDVVAALLELLDVARGGRLGDLVGEQEVLRVALGDVHDVSLASLAPKLTQEDDFHGKLLRSAGLRRLLVLLRGTRDVVRLLAPLQVTEVGPNVHEPRDGQYNELHFQIERQSAQEKRGQVAQVLVSDEPDEHGDSLRREGEPQCHDQIGRNHEDTLWQERGSGELHGERGDVGDEQGHHPEGKVIVDEPWHLECQRLLVLGRKPYAEAGKEELSPGPAMT